MQGGPGLQFSWIHVHFEDTHFARTWALLGGLGCEASVARSTAKEVGRWASRGKWANLARPKWKKVWFQV
jgi:hypothetical protein